ncbi:MAG TPA: hypothetical protein VLJ83_06700 [Gemmatimonadaceae bacterium]|nr:hypothetical protein [Gemmatimonadaceae bacterium]
MAADGEKLPLEVVHFAMKRADRVRFIMQSARLARCVLAAMIAAVACGRDSTAHAARQPPTVENLADGQASAIVTHGIPPARYSGSDDRGVPHYFDGKLDPDAIGVLRRAFGVVATAHLYISDSSSAGLLKYDPQAKSCATCYVNSYRIGFISIRRPGESWEDLERRLRTMSRSSFVRSSLVTSTSVSAMDPAIQGEVAQMLDAAHRLGFRTHIMSTYRSPGQEALLMREGGGRTHTLTSLHSYGRAIDVQIDDGRLGNPSTRRHWIAFRQWVTRFHGNVFHVLGAADKTWDWPHVELPSEKIGFRSIDAAVAAGRKCLSDGPRRACEFLPNLPQVH